MDTLNERELPVTDDGHDGEFDSRESDSQKYDSREPYSLELQETAESPAADTAKGTPAADIPQPDRWLQPLDTVQPPPTSRQPAENTAQRDATTQQAAVPNPPVLPIDSAPQPWVPPVAAAPYAPPNPPYGQYPPQPGGFPPPAAYQPPWGIPASPTMQPPMPAASAPMAPPVDSNRPLVVVASRMISESEYLLLNKMVQKGVVPLLMGMLGLILFVSLVSCIANLYWPLALTAIGIGVVIAAVFIPLFLRARRLAIRAQFQISRSLHTGEGLVELYPDRLVDLSSTSRLEIPFNQIKMVIETPSFLAVSNYVAQTSIFRAEDLTPYDAQLIRQIILANKGKAIYRHKGMLEPRLSQPLPIPVINVQEAVRWDCQSMRGVSMAKSRYTVQIICYELAAFLLPIMLMVGANSIDSESVTPILDMLSGMAIIIPSTLVVFGILMLIITLNKRKLAKNNPFWFCVTDFGISYRLFGYQIRIPWDTLAWRTTEHRLVVGIIVNDQPQPLFTFDLHKMPDAQRLTALFGSHAAGAGDNHQIDEA